MDEADKYQQRLQALADKRKQEEEEERCRREVEEEWLKLAQKKRKSLRDQWLKEVPSVPVAVSSSATAADSSPAGPGAPVWPPADGQDGGQEGEQEYLAHENEEETPVQDGTQTNAALNNRHQAPYQVHTDNNTPEGGSPWHGEGMLLPSLPIQPIHNGEADRSVFGMLEIRVEKDLKTGATVIKSVAPLLSTNLPDGEASEMVFDDGRKSIRAVATSSSSTRDTAAQPSAEELGQVLNTLAEVGVPVLLEAQGLVGPSDKGQSGGGGGGGEWEEAEEERLDEVVDPDMEEDRDPAEPCSKNSQELEPEEEETNSVREERAAAVVEVDTINGMDGDTDDSFVDTLEMELDQEKEEEEEEEEGEEEEEEDGEEEDMFRPEEGLDPVTLTFLGFSQAASEVGQGNQDDGSLVRVERVIVCEDSDDEGVDEETEKEDEKEGREDQSQDLELVSHSKDFRHASSHPDLAVQLKQQSRESGGGLPEVGSSDPGLYSPPGKTDPRPQTTQEGEEEYTATNGHNSGVVGHQGDATGLATCVDTSLKNNKHQDGSSPGGSSQLKEQPGQKGTRTGEGTEEEAGDEEDEMGCGEGAVERESLDDVFQDVNPEEMEESQQQQQAGATSSAGQPISRAEAAAIAPKHKTCQCCVIM